MLELTLVAASLGLSNMAAAIGIGVGGVSPRTRLRVGLIFGLFEAGMPILGLLIGHSLASLIGRQASWLAGGLLIAAGCYSVFSGLRADRAPDPERPHRSAPELLRLLVSGLALSLDNLVVGFATRLLPGRRPGRRGRDRRGQRGDVTGRAGVRGAHRAAGRRARPGRRRGHPGERWTRGGTRRAWLTLGYSCRLSAAFGQERTACLTDSASAPGTSSTLMCRTSSSSTS